MASAPSAISFPPATFAKLSPAPFVLAHLKPTSSSQSSTRPSGRSPSEFRSPTINTGSLTHASGSAVVRIGDTAVVCGVRGEILRASDIPHPYTTSGPGDDGSKEIEELGLLIPNLELSTGCSPAHLPGNAPSTLAQSLSQRLLSLLHISKLVDGRELRIEYQAPQTDDEVPDQPSEVVTKAYWALYIDLLFISLDGNPFDAAWAAIIAALRDVRLPNAWWDPDREAVLCSDRVAESKRLNLRGMPIASTFAVFSTANPQRRREEAEIWVLADPDGFEEEQCAETVTIVVAPKQGGKGGVLRIEKSGGGVVGREEMADLISQAEDRWSGWEQVLLQERQ
ncbi:hypothetical protein M8818_003008 [Zalaria obscura]|uniref:Uncharacterized protein n=1 Tax=Zalaria obscura TaxID=2024903 RepID=A0ACC3SGB7_9PEZI